MASLPLARKSRRGDDATHANRDPRLPRVVDDGDVLTCGGVTSGFDLAFHLVDRYWGEELSDNIATLMEHERRSARSTGART